MKKILFKETDTPGVGKISKDLDTSLVAETKKFFEKRKDSELVEFVQEGEIVKLAIRTEFVQDPEEQEPYCREEAKQTCYDVKRAYEEAMINLFSVIGMSIQGVKVNENSVEFEVYFTFPYKQNSTEVVKQVVKESVRRTLTEKKVSNDHLIENIIGKSIASELKAHISPKDYKALNDAIVQLDDVVDNSKFDISALEDPDAVYDAGSALDYFTNYAEQVQTSEELSEDEELKVSHLYSINHS